MRSPERRIRFKALGLRIKAKIDNSPEERHMAWTTPRVIEISVGMEINCYACAEI